MMKYWWVNHNKTGEQEVSGGFLWSPQKNNDGRKNQTYENMLLANPGDPILSYRSSAIRGAGFVIAQAFEAQKPAEFGQAGHEWANIGWRLPVSFAPRPLNFSPRQCLEQLRPLLPKRYSPIVSTTGNGAQSYLHEISEELFCEVFRLLTEQKK